MLNKLETIYSKLSEGRKTIVDKLIERNWFKKTSLSIQEKILELPKDFDGFLRELSLRQDVIGNFEVVSMTELSVTKTMVMMRFKVASSLTNETHEYEYFSHMTGNNPNCRGIVLIEEMGVLKYFILKKTVDFAAGTSVLGSISSYYPQFTSNNLVQLPAKIETQIKKMLDSKSLNIKRYIDLGGVFTDSIMTSNFTSLFAIVVTLDKEVPESPKMADLEMESIDKIGLYINKSNDGYFLAIASRLAALNVINLI